jgi:hypothetical protein
VALALAWIEEINAFILVGKENLGHNLEYRSKYSIII